jgi:hypothetical protein
MQAGHWYEKLHCPKWYPTPPAETYSYLGPTNKRYGPIDPGSRSERPGYSSRMRCAPQIPPLVSEFPCAPIENVRVSIWRTWISMCWLQWLYETRKKSIRCHRRNAADTRVAVICIRHVHHIHVQRSHLFWPQYGSHTTGTLGQYRKSYTVVKNFLKPRSQPEVFSKSFNK